MDFDIQCCAPEEGLPQAGEDIAVLSQQYFKLTHSKKFERLVTELAADHEGLTPVQQKVVEHLSDDWKKIKNIDAKLNYEMSLASSRAYAKWLEAKKENDFSIFRDAFAALIGYTQKTIDLRDEKKATYYDTCLDDFEKGGSIQQLDAFFGALKARIVPLLARIQKDGKPIRTDFMTRPCPIPQQEAFSKYLLELEGLRQKALVLMTTEHPFTTNFGQHDVRVTTHYYEENFISNIFTTLHEGGHALFMQNEPDEFYREHACDSMSSAMHECISRFYENLIGRSEAFIHFVYPKLREITGDTFADMTERELYEAVNVAQPGLIRCDADELTYCLHILVRYELEKAFVNGEITVDEIPALWNAKYKEYLGVDVPDDTHGCLQDIHWAMGDMGYFPSYALGSAYSAQAVDDLRKTMDLDAQWAEGNMQPLKDALRSRVWQHGRAKEPQWLVQSLCGGAFDAAHYTNYLKNKYTELYGL